jgi:hypothetical protein
MMRKRSCAVETLGSLAHHSNQCPQNAARRPKLARIVQPHGYPPTYRHDHIIVITIIMMIIIMNPNATVRRHLLCNLLRSMRCVGTFRNFDPYTCARFTLLSTPKILK